MFQQTFAAGRIAAFTGMIGCRRFAGLPLVMLLSIVTFWLGGGWLWFGGALLLLLNLACDEFAGDFADDVERPNPVFLNAMLYVTVPLTGIMTVALLAQAASQGSPLSGLIPPQAGGGQILTLGTLGAIFTTGIVGGWASGSFAHELMHRSTRYEWFFAQILLARCIYTAYAIEHVYGHHRNVGLSEDVATVRRGMTLWQYLPKALWGVHCGAAIIEARRMRRRGLRIVNVHNRFLQGIAMEVAFLGGAFALAGWSGLVAFGLSAAISLLVIESGTYIAHYGLVRAPGRPVCPRHSWNAPRFFSASTMVNLPRHSHHHQIASKPYWELVVLDDAPIFPFGTAVMSVVAFWPKLFFAIVGPPLRDWDERLASEEEVALLASGGIEAASREP